MRVRDSFTCSSIKSKSSSLPCTQCYSRLADQNDEGDLQIKCLLLHALAPPPAMHTGVVLLFVTERVACATSKQSCF